MLKRLYIENFALIDKLEIYPGSGMNILTGETGGGKSIIVGAIARLLGAKADRDDIRSGTKLAILESDFEIKNLPKVKAQLKRCEIEYEKNIITIRREISQTKRSRNFINDQVVTLAQLREISLPLAELFGQHSHQLLLDEKNHLGFLDRFAGLTNEISELRQLFNRWDETTKQLERLRQHREIEKNERELLLFQKDEIEKSKIQVGEEEALLSEKKILDSSQILGEKSASVLEGVDRSENSALAILGECQKDMTLMFSLDKSLSEKAELLHQSLINLEELRSEMEVYLSSIPDDPARLEEINLRLDEIYRLKKKYGGSESAILTTLGKISEQLKQKIDVDDRLQLLENQEKSDRENYSILALAVSSRRIKHSKILSGKVQKELAGLGIENALFEFEFLYEENADGIKLNNRRVKPTADGLEQGRLLISANPGEPLRPLVKTASGGEISRIMLALKAVDKTGSKVGQRLLVFDEIDAGIGGNTAKAVAKRLFALSKNYQLLVITHLHQIASIGEIHFAVTKTEADRRNRTEKRKIIRVEKLTGKAKKKEIDRMLAI